MRKRLFAGLPVLLLLATMLAGCAEQTATESMSESAESAVSVGDAVEDRLRQAFLAQYVQDPSYTAADLRVVYIGRFDGYDAVYVNGALDYNTAEGQETVNGVTFLYNSGQHLLVYYHGDGRLYSLQEAFDAGVLDETGLLNVLAAHRTAEPSRYREHTTEEETNMMTKATEDGVKQAYLQKYRPDPAKCTAESLSVRLFGVFGGCYAVYVNGPFAYRTAITTQTVNGLQFVYSTSQTLLIYRDGSLYTLPEAWDAGVISGTALRELYEAFPRKGNLATE